MNQQNLQPYNDIITRPHYVSAVRPHMSRRNRAAQFAPFAALTGYEDAVSETARLTSRKGELTEDETAHLDEQLQLLQDRISERPLVTVTCFVPDARKEGGSYETFSGHVRRIDEYERVMILTDGRRLELSEICSIMI